MGRGKSAFIDFSGGFSPTESQDQLRSRLAQIAEIESGRKAGAIKGERAVNAAMEELNRLRGKPPIEFDYEPSDD